MAIEIVDFPINSMVIFHCKMLVHQRVVGLNMGLSWHYHGIYMYIYIYICICVAMVINLGIEHGYWGLNMVIMGYKMGYFCSNNRILGTVRHLRASLVMFCCYLMVILNGLLRINH